MATDQPHTGMGATLKRYNGTTYVAVLGIKTIGGLNISRDSHDTTDLSSATPWRTHIAGLSDAGEISLSGNWLPAHATQNQTDGGLLGDFDDDSCDSNHPWRIELPECEGDPAQTLDVTGHMNGFRSEISEGLMTFDGSIKVSGRPVLTITA